MSDRNLSALHVAASVLWALGLLLAVADVVGLVRVAPLGLVAVGGAMTLNVRGFLCHMEQRLRRAFYAAGRDAEVSQLTRRR